MVFVYKCYISSHTTKLPHAEKSVKVSFFCIFFIKIIASCQKLEGPEIVKRTLLQPVTNLSKGVAT